MEKFRFCFNIFWNTSKRFGFVTIFSSDIGTFVLSFWYRWHYYRRLSDSLSRGVSDSPTRGVSDSPSFLLNILKPTSQLAESMSHRLPDSPSRRVADSPSRGVVFRLRISPRIRSQNRIGSKGSVRDLWGTNFCKNPRKSASLPCPFKLHRLYYTSCRNSTTRTLSYKIKHEDSSS